MKKTILLLALLSFIMLSKAQTTIPLKSKGFQEKVTFFEMGEVHGHRVDYQIRPNIYGVQYDAWATKYKGKWYSNYPYRVKFSYNWHIVKLYENNVFIYAFTTNGNYNWFTHTIPYQKKTNTGIKHSSSL
jgi:hypothetical protein